MTTSDFTVARHSALGLTLVRARTNRAFGRHSHDQYGLGLIDQGAHRSLSGRGEVEVVAGQVITVNPGEVHDGRPLDGGSRSWRMIYLDPADAMRLTHDSAADYEFVSPASHDVWAAHDLRRLFDQLADSGADSLLCESLLTVLLARLGVRRPGRDHGYPSSVRHAVRLIDDDSARPLSLGELAAAAGLSRFQLIRMFRRATGLTPHAYLIQRRVDDARQRILAGTGLAEAAAIAGFADQSHMTRAFSARYGFTPGRLAAARNIVQD